jgi:hypothetical protein
VVHKQNRKDDLKKRFELYAKDKKATAKLIKDFLESVNPTAKELFEALKSFAEAQKAGSEQFLNMINETISILRSELEKRELNESQRDKIYDRIIGLLLMAQEETRENRTFNHKMAVYALGFGLVAVGGAIVIATKGQNKEVLQKGIDMFVKK